MQITTDKKPLVSVIIDAYNYGRFVEEAVDSVLNQTFPQKDLEILVVDDGSTDDTAERIKKYKDKIKYIYKTNGGQASAFNAGFEKAQGEIIAFLDADDYWAHHKLEVTAELFTKHDAVDFVYHELQLVDGQGNFIELFYDRPVAKVHGRIQLDKYIKGQIPGLPPTSAITARARCLKNILPMPEDYRICADAYLQHFILFHAQEYFYLNQPLTYYRIHGENLYARDQTTKLQKLIITHTLLIRDMEKYGQSSGLNLTLLIKRLKGWISSWQHELMGKKFTLPRIKYFFETRRRLIKDRGLKKYLLLIYHYRKNLMISYLKRPFQAWGLFSNR